ncbi:MAG: hypothetical protein RLZZ383_1606 [Pseudomonadota bacterium]
MIRDILVVSAGPVPAPFGSPVYVGGMAEALADAGYSVRLVGPRRAVGGPLRGVDRPHPVRAVGVDEVQPGPSWRRVGEDVRLVFDLAGALRARRPDLVLGHHGEGWWASKLACWWTGTRVPVVYVLHTSFEEELPTWLPPWAVRHGRWIGRLGGWIDRRIARRAEACLAPSPSGCARLEAWGASWAGLALPDVDVSGWPRPSASEARVALGLPASTPVALYAGNVDAYQDLPRWVDALERLPEVHALFALAAAPPGWLRDAVARVGAAHRVTFTLANDADALGWVHAAADVAVVPRAVCAGVPVKALNSLAYGVPTVGLASALPDLPGLIRVDGDGADALAAAVRDALVGGTSAVRGAAALAGARNGPSWVDALARAVVGPQPGDAGSRDTR